MRQFQMNDDGIDVTQSGSRDPSVAVFASSIDTGVRGRADQYAHPPPALRLNRYDRRRRLAARPVGRHRRLGELDGV